jgi:F0F1-type ATP synthase assembly protein I
MKNNNKQNQSKSSFEKVEKIAEAIVMVGIFLGVNVWAFSGKFTWGLIVFVISIVLAQYFFWKKA